jgi:copper chaperone CopZ
VNLFANLLHALGIGRVDHGRGELTAAGPLVDREFLVPTMVCEGCAERIAGVVTAMPGVRGVTSKVRHKRIRVRYEPEHVREQQLKDALTRIGFEVLDARENT